jgi:lipopolysaccharide transport system ATP-binding protein
MSDSIIQVRGLGKSYNISHEGGKESYTALRDVITNQAKKIFSFPKTLRSGDKRNNSSIEEFWALNDVSFDIHQGDRVGIIGRNGAGKSTLLKILSRITEPTKGEIRIKGRVASLLEVGTGFHPELTGRENIYLNGAILGMSRSEIKKKFDEIVYFAEVEKFLDMPVKRYSSGMYVRLAFAVAAHMEPDILIVDEVLAVGDIQFQKKCLGKMNDVSKVEGRTVLFVSHNLGAINNLCDKSLYMLNGKSHLFADTASVITKYLNNKQPHQSGYFNNYSDKKLWIKKVELDCESCFHDENVNIDFQIAFNISSNKHDYKLFVTVLDEFDFPVFSAETGIVSTEFIRLTIANNFLVRGNYKIEAFIHKPQVEAIDIVKDICHFTIIDNNSYLGIHGNYNYGKVFGKFNWIYKNINFNGKN